MKSHCRGFGSAPGRICRADLALFYLLLAAADCSAENDTGTGAGPTSGKRGSGGSAAGSGGARGSGAVAGKE